jgi:hypothetical protein
MPGISPGHVIEGRSSLEVLVGYLIYKMDFVSRAGLPTATGFSVRSFFLLRAIATVSPARVGNYLTAQFGFFPS